MFYTVSSRTLATLSILLFLVRENKLSGKVLLIVYHHTVSGTYCSCMYTTCLANKLMLSESAI